jgi:radical SAM enzyme (TIGR01210 family)
MKEIAEFCKNLKENYKPKKTNFTKPVSCWSEKDLLNGEITDTFVIIFKTKGCSWAIESGCSMCGYFNDSAWVDISDKDLMAQFEVAMEKYKGERFVKIFTSGSFLDDQEITALVQKKILKKLYETAEKISVESRPEYITDEKISDIKDLYKNKIFEIGIGLETADDNIREKIINKGFTFKDYKKAAELMKKNNIKLKTYVLIKPPYLSEKQAIKDAIKTVEKIKNITDTVSFNPVNVQRNTVVNYLWQRKMYRPAWLFSIVEILKKSKKIAKDLRIKCDIVGGGNIRGAHNCKECDKHFLKAISDFSLSQNTNVFDDLKCSCYDKWLDILDIENLGFGSHVNMYR